MKNLAALYHFNCVSFESVDIGFDENQCKESFKKYGNINSRETLPLNIYTSHITGQLFIDYLVILKCLTRKMIE